MATERDLINAVRDSMEENGQLALMKAKMRTEIMLLLDGKSSKKNAPKIPHDVLILNELIREYLEWSSYLYTSAVFVSESNLAKQPLDRSFILQDLNIKENQDLKDLPLLFNLLQTFKKLNQSSQ